MPKVTTDYTDLLQITQIKAKIVLNKKIFRRYFKMSLQAPRIAKVAMPGQFVNIKVTDNYEPLLRRPFSIHKVFGSNFEILFEVVGKGTEILSKRKAGEYLDIIGPLGNGFDLNRQTGKPANRQTILVAGGMGVAPLLFLAEKLAYSVERRAYRKDKGFELSAKRYPLNAIVLIGAKTKKQILCEKEFKKLGCDVKITTDDGSRGLKGKVTELLKNILRLASAQRSEASPEGISDKRLAIYACGPRPMLKEIANISKKYNIPAQISLEEHMACGIGACLGCVVNTKNGYQRVCKEGPVFAADEIVWEDKDE